MPIEILMPALSPTMKEGNLVRWLKKEGDKLKAGDVMAEIETDKATMEVEVVDEGTLARIVVAAGTENVAVNSVIGVILEDGEDRSALDELKPKASVPASKPEEIKQTPLPQAPAPAPRSEGSRIAASPLARRLAGEKGIALETLVGTGPRGRILRADVEGASQVHTPTREAFTDKPLSSMRKVIAKRLSESKQSVPHFYLTLDVVIDQLVTLRKQINEAFEGGKVTVNDFVIKAVALALQEVPDANVAWMGDTLRHYGTSDIAVAVTTPGGLITPLIKNAETKSLRTISREMKELAERARGAGLRPEEFQGGSFTISNLGMYGISDFTAIINPPQAAILAVGAAEERVIVRGGQMKIATVMTSTLSVDHRAIDGSVGAQWFQAFKKFMENPVLMMA